MAENGHASSRAARLSWVLYDWASSPVPTLHATFVFSVYFTTVIAPENGSLYWAQMTALSAFLLAVAAPVMGRVADTKGVLKQGLIATTLAAALATAALWFIQPSPAFILPALLLSGLAIFLSEAAFLFYNGLLPSVADKQDYGRLSGLGWGTGYFGAIAALVLVLVLFILPDQPVTGTKNQLGGPVQLTMLFAGAWLVFFPASVYFCTKAAGSSAERQPLGAAFVQPETGSSDPRHETVSAGPDGLYRWSCHLICLWRHLCSKSLCLQPDRNFDLCDCPEYHCRHRRGFGRPADRQAGPVFCSAVVFNVPDRAGAGGCAGTRPADFLGSRPCLGRLHRALPVCGTGLDGPACAA